MRKNFKFRIGNKVKVTDEKEEGIHFKFRIGYKVKVINEEREEFNNIGTIVGIGKRDMTKFCLVVFSSDMEYIYFKEEELERFE